jgi:son of sevenless-like protein
LQDLEVIFGDILDVEELTANLLSSLEDTMEATEEGQVPWIGSCFEELIEGEEFDVYNRYTENLLKPNSTDRLYTLLQRNDVIFTCKVSVHFVASFKKICMLFSSAVTRSGFH